MGATHEFGLIDWVRQRSTNSPQVVVGIGDDAAVLGPREGRELLVAKDVLLEGVHFTFPDVTPEGAGRKSLAVNVSDIAAMGGEPLAAFVGLCLPRQRGLAFAQRVEAGLMSLAQELGIAVAGGDTNIWEGPLVVSVTLLGEVPQGKSWLRSGAQPGDRIYVTGPLGGSFPSGRHVSFTPRLDLSRQLRAQGVTVTAMIDISDGLLRDLGHLLDESHVGAEIQAPFIPIHNDVASALPDPQRLQHALADGEDFELVFTVPAAEALRLQELPTLRKPVYIGQIVSEQGLRLLDHHQQPIEVQQTGYEHQF